MTDDTKLPGCFLAILAIIIVTVLACQGCQGPTPQDIEGDPSAVCSDHGSDPDSRSYYHRATESFSTEYPTREDVEAEYHHALDRLGGCPTYLFLDEWCNARPTECGPDTVWWTNMWEGVDTCRDLYWSRGAYCRGVHDGR